MDTLTIVVLVVCVAVAAVALVGALVWQRRQSQDLQQNFGTEYDRSVRKSGSKREAEGELQSRRKRVEALNIKPLSNESAERYRAEWVTAQARFVDEPQAALDDADRLLGEVMQERGYPTGDFEQQAADVSVDHAPFISSYRKAHGIAVAKDAGVEPETEQLRQALVSYRELFDDLLGPAPDTARPSRQEATVAGTGRGNGR